MFIMPYFDGFPFSFHVPGWFHDVSTHMEIRLSAFHGPYHCNTERWLALSLSLCQLFTALSGDFNYILIYFSPLHSPLSFVQLILQLT